MLDRNCKDCGKEFKVWPYKLRVGRGKYCSRACSDKFTLRKGRPAWNKGRKGVFSKEALEKMSLARLGKYKGKNGSNWQGGITGKDRLERNLFADTIRRQVLERDNYTCQSCKEVGGYLQVDHIQDWSSFIEGRFDINNCRTLCQKCHYEITYNKPMPQNIKHWGTTFRQTGRGVD